MNFSSSVIAFPQSHLERFGAPGGPTSFVEMLKLPRRLVL